jgi:hypothetical protein
MSYSGSKAQSGNQAVVSIGTGTSTSSPGTLTTVGEVNDFNQSGTVNKTDDTTNFQSSAEEFIPTILSPGQFQGTMNRISGDAGQVAVKVAFNSAPPLLVPWQVQLAKNPAIPQTTAGDKIVFMGLVEEFSNFGTVKPDKKVATPFRIKVSGVIVETLGS